MRKVKTMRRFLTVLTLAIAAPSSAQIFSNSVIMGMGYTAQAGVSQQPVLHCLRKPCSRGGPSGPGREAATNPVALALAEGSTPPLGRQNSLKYAPSAELAQQARADFIAGLRAGNPDAAQAVEAESRRVDFAKVANDLLGAAGLRADDAADALTLYTAIGYLIANNDMSDPSPAMFRGLRSQIAPRLAADPRFASSTERAKLGEKMKFLTVILHAGWISAQKENNLPRYSRDVARLFQQQGGADLRSVRLTASGFVAR